MSFMGILVNDEVELPNYGFSITGFIITCKGSYQLSKESIQVNGDVQTTYHIHTKLYWEVQNAVIPFNSEAFGMSVSEVPADIFALIYSEVKKRYQNVVDV